MKMRHLLMGALAAFVCVAVAVGHAQQATPAATTPGGGRGQAPAGAPGGRGAGRAPTAPPPIIWPSPPLPDGPIVTDTAIQHQIRLVITKGLNQPWSMAFLPDGGILVTERPGRLRIVRNGVLDPTPVAGLPQVQAAGLAGLMDLALHPQFAENKLVYFTYHKPQVPGPGGLVAGPAGGRGPAPPAGVITLARARWDGAALVEAKDLFSAIPSGNASRIAFGKDGNVYMTIGYGDTPVGNPDPAGAPPQDRMSLAGKVLRLKDDGTVPPDNPFVGRSNSRPEIFTIGHRNALGLTVHPDSGMILESENGPNGGDEINVLLPGKNYGWPVVSYGRFYLGPRVNNHAWQEGMEDPLVFWVPAIATSGLTFYTGDRFPQWKGNMFAGGMRQGEVPRSGHLERIDFNDKWEELHRESMFWELRQRIRDVRQGPDGLLYVLTAENDGALIRIEPAPPTGATK
jgi:glucose/arabinose dehydrogenase